MNRSSHNASLIDPTLLSGTAPTSLIRLAPECEEQSVTYGYFLLYYRPGQRERTDHNLGIGAICPEPVPFRYAEAYPMEWRVNCSLVSASRLGDSL